MTKKNIVLDLLYESEQEENIIIKPRKKRTEEQLLPISVQPNSLSHIALNILPSTEPYFGQGSATKHEFAVKLHRLRTKISGIVKKIAEKHNMSAKDVQACVMDPESEIGKQTLKKIDPQARLVGLNGEESTSWFPVAKLMGVKDIAGYVAPELNANSDDDEEREEEEIGKNAPIMNKYANRSAETQEDKEVFLNFFNKAMELSINDPNWNTLRFPNKGVKSDSSERDPAEYMSAIFSTYTVVFGIAALMGEMAVCGLLAFEIDHEGDSNNDDDDKSITDKFHQAVLDKFTAAFQKKLQSIDIDLKPLHIQYLTRRFLKIANEAISQSKIDDDWKEETNALVKAMSSDYKNIGYKKTFFSPRLKDAISDASERIFSELKEDKDLREALTARKLHGSTMGPEILKYIKDPIRRQEIGKTIEVSKKAEDLANKFMARRDGSSPKDRMTPEEIVQKKKEIRDRVRFLNDDDLKEKEKEKEPLTDFEQRRLDRINAANVRREKFAKMNQKVGLESFRNYISKN